MTRVDYLRALLEKHNFHRTAGIICSNINYSEEDKFALLLTAATDRAVCIYEPTRSYGPDETRRRRCSKCLELWAMNHADADNPYTDPETGKVEPCPLQDPVFNGIEE